jgi:hypothetical protein
VNKGILPEKNNKNIKILHSLTQKRKHKLKTKSVHTKAIGPNQQHEKKLNPPCFLKVLLIQDKWNNSSIQQKDNKTEKPASLID